MLSGCWRALALLLALSLAVFAGAAAAAEPASQAPTYQDTQTLLRDLAQSGQFSVLEQRLGEVAASDQLFADGSDTGAAVHSTLRLILNPAYSATGADGILERWRAAFPQSGFIAIADAIVLQDAAAAVRGSLPAHLIPPESHELFTAKLRQADRVLMGAPAAVKDTAVWHLVRLQILCGLRDKQAHAVFDEAMQRWPRHRGFYRTVVDLLIPEEGGSWAAVAAFIEDAARRTAPTDSAALYAELYAYVRNEVASGRLALNWPRVKDGFADWMRRDPNPLIANVYASFACFGRDKPAFQDAMRIAGDEIVAGQWLTGHGPAACRRWADN